MIIHQIKITADAVRSARRQTGNFYRTDTFTRLRLACKMPAQKSSKFSVNSNLFGAGAAGLAARGGLRCPGKGEGEMITEKQTQRDLSGGFCRRVLLSE